MMRQPFSAAAIPYKSNIIRNGSILKAVEYDLGRNGIAYYDLDTADYHISGKPGKGNLGRCYRNDGVDIRKDSSRYESYYVSDMEAGEWLQFTVNVLAKAHYDLVFETSADTTGGRLSIIIGAGINPISINIPPPGKRLEWPTTKLQNISLNEGRQVIKLMVVSGGFNLRSIKFRRVN